MGILNNEINYIEKEGYKVLNLYQDKVIDIDYNHDLYNYGHLNVYGASKYTIYLANYLKENYNLPDHRQDKKYSSWNEEYIRFKNKFKELTKEDYEEVINNVK